MVHTLQVKGLTPFINRVKSISAQIIASMLPNFLLMDLGMAVNFPTIAVPDLLNAQEGLSLDDFQASWFGSLSFLTQPIGAFLSGPIVDYFGRKRASILVNIPHVVAWLLMYFAWDVPSLFIANALLGVGTGLMEAPITSYVSEISEPSLRGALSTVTQLFFAIGTLNIYYLGTIVTWRTAALISLAAPILASLLSLFIPETPIWLLSKKREEDALKSLRYLRGWTTSEQVTEEFNQLVVHSKDLHRCCICLAEDVTRKAEECPHIKMNLFKRYFLKFKHDMFIKETLRPFSMILLYFLFYEMSSLTPLRPNMVNICGAVGMADDGKHIVLVVGILSLVIAVLAVGLIKICGKRKLGLTGMIGSAIAYTALSIYAKNNLEDSVFSYDVATFPRETSYWPLIFLYALTVFAGFNVSWVLLGEIFPFRSRASAQGITTAWDYIISFIGTKILIDLETNFKLSGTFAVYAIFGYVGTVYLYFFMPETEGVPLHEIEKLYTGNFRTFADDPFINLFKRIFGVKLKHDIENKEETDRSETRF
ncbi:hypothetical protein K1T71_012254 [Dendrolimus kikuchii]|uniref:Uncharacterized protein n=1 Tax=Dendrolimus kikuchii TaxID=765133 RepID=A0ACC1CLF5_9NEOP|nr:hypothetical protein K1T71_012254 [Dendrolimus kikuchii]